MEERDRDVTSMQQQNQPSHSTPQAAAAATAATTAVAALPSMNTTSSAQHQQYQHPQAYAPLQHSQYAPSSASQQQHHHHHHQQQYYEQRDGHHVSSHQPYDYRPVALHNTQSTAVSLPSIQHLDNSNAVVSAPNNSSNMNAQPTLPPPVQQQQHAPPPPSQHSQAYAPSTADNGPHTQQDYASPPGRTHFAIRNQQQQAMYTPQYAPSQYHPYDHSSVHHQPPPPPSAMMPSNMPNGSAMRYGIPPNPQMDPRQMSGGRNKKEIKRRTKTGCLTCRKRRIKCDERHPHCRNCEKSKRECLGYDPVFKSQPAQAPLQPAPLPGQMPKQDQTYHMGYAYHSAEDLYAARPPPAPSMMPSQGTPLANGSGDNHEAGPLTDSDPNRRHIQPEASIETTRKDSGPHRWMSVDARPEEQ